MRLKVSTDQTTGEELLGRLRSLTSQALAEQGLAGERLESATALVVTRFAAEFGGQVVYVPLDRQGKIRRRNAEIVAEFNGKNQVAIAKRLGVSVSTVYCALKIDQIRQAMAKEQGGQAA